MTEFEKSIASSVSSPLNKLGLLNILISFLESRKIGHVMILQIFPIEFTIAICDES